MTKPIFVIKRDGSKEELNLDKIHRVVSWACEGLTGVSQSEVELRAQLQIAQNTNTADIHEMLIKSASELISEETPNYQYVAARLVNYQLRKEVYGGPTPPTVKEIVEKNVNLGVYTKELLERFTDDDWARVEKIIRHDRDDIIAFAGMEQWRGKYLIRNRVTGQFYETPQVANLLISMLGFVDYPVDTRIEYIREFYNALSTFDISLPTPVMGALRTPEKQFSSCVVISSGDDLDSIFNTATNIGKYIANKAGIGLDVGSIRSIGSPIRGGSVEHTGLIPFLRMFQSAVKSTAQGGIRGGAATVHIPLWHYEFEDLVVLKNNRGTEFNRVRQMDYCFQLNRLMYTRLIKGGDITFFSPSDVPGLLEAFYADQDEFERLYEKYERSTKIRKTTMKAIDVFSKLMTERKETGRIYIQNIDLVNEHGSFDPTHHPITQSNLCQEIALPTIPTRTYEKRVVRVKKSEVVDFLMEVKGTTDHEIAKIGARLNKNK